MIAHINSTEGFEIESLEYPARGVSEPRESPPIPGPGILKQFRVRSQFDPHGWDRWK